MAEQRQALENVRALANTLNQGNLSSMNTTDTADGVRRQFRGVRIITEDNMGTARTPIRQWSLLPFLSNGRRHSQT